MFCLIHPAKVLLPIPYPPGKGRSGVSGFVEKFGKLNARDPVPHDGAPEDAGPRGGNERVQRLMGEEEITPVGGKGDVTHIVPRQGSGADEAKVR